jgi:hypothetical protein
MGDGLLLKSAFMSPGMDAGRDQRGGIASQLSCVMKR